NSQGSRMSSVTQLFRQVVQRCQDHVAIAGTTESLTYRALQERALQVADFLVSRRVSPGSVIAVLSEEPANIIATMLGILEAGCVFCPLHRNQPPSRLNAIVDQIAPDWFFAEPRLAHRP